MEKRQNPDARPTELRDPKLPEFHAEAPGNRAMDRVCQTPAIAPEVQN